MGIFKNKNTFILLFISSLLVLSCKSNLVYTDSKTMPGKTWRLMDVSVFNVPVTDTLSSTDVSFTIRTGTDYPFRNIYLFVTTISPGGKSISDTLQYYLADEKGNWKGKGFGDIKEITLPYKTNIYFPQKGTYQFRIMHGMRMEDLKGVYDIGLRISRTSK